MTRIGSIAPPPSRIIRQPVVVLVLLAAALATAPAAGAADTCLPRAESRTDDEGRTFTPLYYCSTYVGSPVYGNPTGTSPLDDSGFMNAAPEVWVICQKQGRANPVIQGNANTWWLYTQGDEARPNEYGYELGWGYLPATAVSQGVQNAQVPGVPVCSASPPSTTTPPPPPPPGTPPCDDCDHDGFLKLVDCDDTSPAIHPGAADVPGNAVDEDCAGGPAGYAPLDATVSYAFIFSRGATIFTQLAVRRAEAGSTIRVLCRGGGCRFASKTRHVARATSRLAITSVVRRMRLRPGARLEVRVTKAGAIGVVRRLTVRAGRRAPRSAELCLPPAARQPARCEL
jgi:hypothetical protein